MQELCDGSVELSVSLLVLAGEILDAVCTEYVYDKERYVWPHVGELQDRRRSHDSIPAERRTVLKAPAHRRLGQNGMPARRPARTQCVWGKAPRAARRRSPEGRTCKWAARGRGRSGTHGRCLQHRHLAVMKAFLPGYSGICNFNYKVRADGRMCIFEVRPSALRLHVPPPHSRTTRTAAAT